MPPKIYPASMLREHFQGAPVSKSKQENVLLCDFTMRPSTDEAKLNKTEKSWLEILRSRGVEDIGIQDVTFKFGNDLRYTCDFNGFVDGRWMFWEVKGFYRDDARVKLLAVARMRRRFDFILVTKEKGQWVETEVKP